MKNKLLEIIDLHANIDGKEILKGLNLTIYEGEVNAIMGPNGSGKSTLSYILSGRDGYEVTAGRILYKGNDLLALSADERARGGLFLAFQYPVEIPGITGMVFMREAYNSRLKARGQKEVDALEFVKFVRTKSTPLGIDNDMLKRFVNVGFSGGEKKRFETLQMSVLEPDMAILDETDSGLDIDALKIVSDGVNMLRDDRRGFLIITHYQRLLSYIIPDHVHVMAGGRILKSGGRELALELEEKGYADIIENARDMGEKTSC